MSQYQPDSGHFPLPACSLTCILTHSLLTCNNPCSCYSHHPTAPSTCSSVLTSLITIAVYICIGPFTPSPCGIVNVVLSCCFPAFPCCLTLTHDIIKERNQRCLLVKDRISSFYSHTLCAIPPDLFCNTLS